ncbi:carbohydrate-binding protein [Parafrigoribacterium humi]|uniref:hypothetical protein n=1 Tax=Parafrigoribacterium humi TaxID=3144664 RepID=UPI0032EE17D1
MSSALAGVGYNTNSINRYADISINSGATTRLCFRATGSWSSFLTGVVPVHLNAGSNSIKFSNSTAYAPDIDKVSIAAQLG